VNNINFFISIFLVLYKIYSLIKINIHTQKIPNDFQEGKKIQTIIIQNWYYDFVCVNEFNILILRRWVMKMGKDNEKYNINIYLL